MICPGAVATRPDDKTFQQTQTWKDCKGAYRFVDNDKVTFAEIIRPHCEATRAYAQIAIWLSLCDMTEVSFRPRRNIDGLRPDCKPLPGALINHDCDRGADDYDFFSHVVQN